MVPVYITAGMFFAALAARGLLVPLRANELGAGRLSIGLLFSASTLAAAALSLPAGLLADRFGRRRVIIASAVLGGVSQLGVALTGSIALYFFWQLLAGLGAGAAQAAIFAAVADSVPARRVGRALGYVTLAMQLGFLGGPTLAGLLLQWVSVPADLAITTAFYAVAVGLGMLSPRSTPNHAVGWNLWRPARRIARRHGFPAAALALFGAAAAWGTGQAFLPVFAKQALLLPGAAVGYLLALQALSNGVSRVPVGRLIDRAPRRGAIVAIGMIGFAVSLLVLPHVRGFWLPALVLIAGAPFLAIAFVGVSVAFSSLAPAGERGVAMGVYGTALYLGLAAGPAVFGPLMSSFGYTAGFTACGVVTLVFAAAALGVRAWSRRAFVLPPVVPGT